MKFESLVLGFVICIQAPSGAYALTYAATPDAGMSDEYLISLGRRHAIDLLLFRLEKAEYQEHHFGIIDRLDQFLELAPDLKIVSALNRHTRAQIAGGRLSEKQIEELCWVLRLIGARGGEEGVASLLVFLRDDSPLAQLPRVATESGASHRHPGRLARCALVGIGLSGHDRSEAALSQVRNQPPAFIQGVVSESDFDWSLGLSKRVRTEGVRAVFKARGFNAFEKISE